MLKHIAIAALIAALTAQAAADTTETGGEFIAKGVVLHEGASATFANEIMRHSGSAPEFVLGVLREGRNQLHIYKDVETAAEEHNDLFTPMRSMISAGTLAFYSYNGGRSLNFIQSTMMDSRLAGRNKEEGEQIRRNIVMQQMMHAFNHQASGGERFISDDRRFQRAYYDDMVQAMATWKLHDPDNLIRKFPNFFGNEKAAFAIAAAHILAPSPHEAERDKLEFLLKNSLVVTRTILEEEERSYPNKKKAQEEAIKQQAIREKAEQEEKALRRAQQEEMHKRNMEEAIKKQEEMLGRKLPRYR